MAVPVIASSATTNASAATSIAATKPSGVTSGDLLICAVTCVFAQTQSTPSGWTLLISEFNDGNAANGCEVYYRVSDGTEGSTITFSIGGSSDITAHMWRITGFNASDIVNGTNTNSATSGSTTAITSPSVTTDADNCLIIRFGATRESSGITDPASHTALTAETTGTAAADSTSQAVYTSQVSAGATGTAAFVSSVGNREWVAFTIAINEAPPAIDQEGFRFRDDTGNEATPSWQEAQDTNITWPLSTNLIPRFIVNTADDPGATAFTLRYQKNGTGGYVAVPLVSSSTVAPTVEAADCTESGNNTATTSWAVDYPAYVSGDLLIFHVASDADVTHNWPATGPNGETIVDIVDSTGGTAQRASAFYFVGSATTIAGTLTVTPSATEQWTAVVLKVPAGEFNASTPIQTNTGTANDTTADTSWDTPAWTSESTADGRIVCFAAHDVVTTTATPGGWATLIARDRGAVGCTLAARDAANTASESIASASFTKTSETDSSIGYVINGAVITNEIYVSPSANIAAGGEATTAQLTSPSGKTSGDFTTGRRWDDENGTDTIDLGSNDYTELEWCLIAQSPAVNTDYFDLRVYKDSTTALETYSVTPRWTIGTHGGGGATNPKGVFGLALNGPLRRVAF